MTIIEIHHVTKDFRLGQAQNFRGAILNSVRRLFGHAVEKRPLLHALSDVTFSVNPGEVIGIIGHNGAGKSTLLKLISGITPPTKGHLTVGGSIAPLIEVGAGFLPDFTGRENIYLNGAILGIPKKILDRKLEEIVAFAELDSFIDTPIKRYSSGMQVRLGFALATSMDADILIVDEVLAVGDLAFQRKCFDRIDDLIKRGGKTVLLVSHNIRQVERICSRVLLLTKGKVAMDGDPQAVCNYFYEESDAKILAEKAKLIRTGNVKVLSSGEVELLEFAAYNASGDRVQDIRYLEDITIAMVFRVRRPISKPIFGIGVHTTDFVYLTTNHNAVTQSPDLVREGIYKVRCTIYAFPFLPGTYAFRVGVASGDLHNTLFYEENTHSFRVVAEAIDRSHPDIAESLVEIDTLWQVPTQTDNDALNAARAASVPSQG